MKSNLNKWIFILGLEICGIGVALDLATTWVAINFFHSYETRIFGNMPFVAFPVFLGLTAFFYWVSEWLPSHIEGDPGFFKIIWKGIFVIFVFLPFYGAIHNIVFLANL